MANKIIAFRLDEKMIKMLKEASRKEGREGNISRTIRRILERYFFIGESNK